ncbi:antibiotic biosynthesis monooxygenase [Pseudomonas tolaasii]|uniref:putative quinol monooxygenase n=1 Tax=Pseudomonas tolaasii TaxID=29442 RepID=UPI001C5986FB|nr:antibiotic biosynthesis monooxygenase family protein [Pseudomonas tolaasii]MBW1248759.1 antibiotic biosynthesis monooxygenase [Pseudomonas tolaasii]
MNSLKKYSLGALIAATAFISSQAAMAEIVLQPSPNGEVALVVNFEVKPGAEAEFEKVFRRSVTCSRLEPGNITFNVHKILGTERNYVLYEVWRNEAAVNSHFARPYTVALFSMFDRNLARPLSEGGLRFVQDLQPEARKAPAKTEPASVAECR